jgi:alkylhydroperoxidase family enzyme
MPSSRPSSGYCVDSHRRAYRQAVYANDAKRTRGTVDMTRSPGRPRTPQEAAAVQAGHQLRREQSRGGAGCGCGPLARGDQREAAVGRVRAEVVADSIEGVARSAHDD